jgi:hypothetical protein
MPNLFAHLVLYSFPLVVLVLFKRLPRHEALIWSILGGYLFLPEQTGIDLPLLPELNKVLIPSLTAAILCLVLPDATAMPRRRSQARETTEKGERDRQRSVIATLCVVILLLLPIATMQTNQDPVIVGPRFIPGLREYDIFSMALSTAVMLLPFLLARRYLASQKAQLALLRALVVGGLVYSVMILVELRLSPQLNRWIYGFHAHSFAQHVRNGGFRPMMFLEHGLRVGIFILMGVFAAGILWRFGQAAGSDAAPVAGRRNKRGPASNQQYLLWCGWLFVVLFLSKTLGAFLIALVLLPIVLLLKARTQILVAAVIAAMVILYPSLRQTNLLPISAVQDLASSISAERSQSFNFRLDNEEILLARADTKPFFGWGGWGRSRIYDAFSGRDISVTDGTWVIVFGVSGWIGYLATFGLLTLPIFMLVRKRRSVNLVTSGLTLILAANLVDLIPNSSLTPLTWMIAGTVLGALEMTRQTEIKGNGAPRLQRQMQTQTQRRVLTTTRRPPARNAR